MIRLFAGAACAIAISFLPFDAWLLTLLGFMIGVAAMAFQAAAALRRQRRRVQPRPPSRFHIWLRG